MKNMEEIYDFIFELHLSTFRNEELIKNSKACGCCFCKKIFKPEDVKEWCDDDGRGDGDRTACCPHCTIDTVIGDASGVYITPSLLDLLNLHYIGDDIGNVDITMTELNLKSIQCKI